MPDNVVELRQYILHPGMRDTLIDLFDREFIEPQEALGMSLIGQFRTLEDPDRFVWLRSFPDMRARARALTAFYSGPVWAKHRDAANATIVDSDNVLLLRPARPDSGFSLMDGERPPIGSTEIAARRFTAAIYSFEKPVENEFAEHFESEIKPKLVKTGASVLGTFVTESTPNDYPRLPVREGAHVFAAFAALKDASPTWPGATEVWTLTPTARSSLR